MSSDMSLQEMLEELLRFYPIANRKDEDIAQDLVTYRELILGEVYSSNEQYDWQECLRYIQKHRTYKNFPAIPDILEAMPHAIIKKETPFIVEDKDINEDKLLTVTLPSGFIYSFTFKTNGKSLKELKADARRRFGECEIKMYPKGSVLIGKEVITP